MTRARRPYPPATVSAAAMLAAALLLAAILGERPAPVLATPPEPARSTIAYPRDAGGGCSLKAAKSLCAALTGDGRLCRSIARADVSPDGPGRCELRLVLPDDSAAG